MNFRNLLGKQVLKNHNCNPFQSSPNLSTCFSFYICCVIYTLYSCFEQLNLSFTQLGGGPYCLNLLHFVTQLLQGSYWMKGKSYYYFRSEEDHLCTQIPFLWTIWLLDHQLKWKSGFHLFLLQHPVLGPPSGPARRVMSVYLGFHYNEQLHTINDWLLKILLNLLIDKSILSLFQVSRWWSVGQKSSEQETHPKKGPAEWRTTSSCQSEYEELRNTDFHK